jgi:hypothetical protein
LDSDTVSEKLLKVPLFGPSLIHQLRLVRSKQHLQNGVLLTSFSAWGAENNLAEINLEGTRGGLIRGCNIFWDQKLANTCSFVGRCIIMQHEKFSREERSWMNPLNVRQEVIHYSFIKFCIYCFFLWYEFFVHYALRVK